MYVHKVYVYIYVYAYVYVYMTVYMYAHMYYLSICKRMYVCVYIHIYEAWFTPELSIIFSLKKKEEEDNSQNFDLKLGTLTLAALISSRWWLPRGEYNSSGMQKST